MAKFVKVTGVDGLIIWINEEQILYIFPEEDNKGNVYSRIQFMDNRWINAKLDPTTLMMTEIGT